MKHIDSQRTGMASEQHSRRTGVAALAVIMLIYLLLGIAAVAAEPEIVRLRVPAKTTSRWFPPGTELRVLSAGAFESLLERALDGERRRLATEAPRLVRARHRARWEGEVLTGETDLVIARSAAGPAEYMLDVWSPAVVLTTTRGGELLEDGELPAVLFAEPAKAGQAFQSLLSDSAMGTLFGARDSGVQSISVERHPRQAVHLEWELQPQERVRGRSMRLALPGEATTVLELELPKDWVVSVRVGRRRGPLVSERAGRVNWEIEPELGRIEVDLANPGEGDLPAMSDLWVSGRTEVHLAGAAVQAAAPANWSTEWLLELDPRNPKVLEVELDPGLELIEVVGPAVREFRTRPGREGERVSVALEGGLRSMTEVRFIGHARVPREGMWPIPAIKPLNATWTGGTTAVWLDSNHVVTRCVEKAGRRIAARSRESAVGNQLIFEAGTPRSVGELEFGRAGSQASCLVRGQLYVMGSPARLECQLDWSGPDGLPPELELELSPGWIAERVVMRGVTDPLLWHSSPTRRSGTKLQIAIPSSAQRKEIALILSAGSSSPDSRGPLELPRVTPLGARIIDDAWLAWADQTTMIRPMDAHGLAWIDPASVVGLVSGQAGGADVREALAWRWVGENCTGRMNRESIEQEPSASIDLNASVDPAKRLVTLDGVLSVQAGAEPLEDIPIWIECPSGLTEGLHFEESGGGIVAQRPLDASLRSTVGFPEGGLGTVLAIRIAGQAEKTVHVHGEYPWVSGSVIPLLAVPRRFVQRGVLTVKTPHSVGSRFNAAGMRVLTAPAGSRENRETNRELEGLARDDFAKDGVMSFHRFSFNQPGARLELFTERLERVPEKGVIREALLSTSVNPIGATIHRLRLLVQDGKARSLDLSMPESVSLVRVRRDGTDVVPIERGEGLSISLPEASAGAKSCMIVLDYVVTSEQGLVSRRMRPVLPAISLPCLSFTWDLIAPDGYEAVDCGPGLTAAEDERSARITDGGLDLWRGFSELMRTAGGPGPDETIRLLDQSLGEWVGDELTLGEWFARWDAGPRAVIVDRLALFRAGLGPKSVCVRSRSTAKGGSTSAETLDRYGLRVLVLPNVFIITSVSEGRRFEERNRVRASVAEALLWGADRDDRFQTLARFRGESSPKTGTLSGEEAVERIKLPPGSSIRHFTAPAWPGAGAVVYIIDVNTRRISAWLIALVVLIAWVLSRRRFAKVSWHYVALVVLLVGSLLLNWFLPSRHAAYAWGPCFGGLLVLVVELGRRFSTNRVSPRRRTESSLVRRAAPAALASGFVGVLIVRSVFAQAAIGPLDDGRMLVLFPYDEEEFDFRRPPQTAIVRLTDFERLSRLAVTEDAGSQSSLRAVSAVHRVLPKSSREAVVESELVLLASGRSPWIWRLPVGGARDIEATLDRQRVPLPILPGGEVAEVTIHKPGNHVLSFRRSFATNSEAGADVLNFAVNPIALARVEVMKVDRRARAPVLAARGGAHLLDDGTLTGRLGPVDRVDVRWPGAGATPVQKQGSSTVEGLVLWDIGPAGDRVRTRLTFQSLGDHRSVRLAHAAGLVLRSARVRDSAANVWCESAKQDEWVLQVDPPLQSGATIEIDCWMPSEISGPGRRPEPPSGMTSELLRRLPMIQPIGAEHYGGSLGVRRPGDWTGRLETLEGGDPISDESFTKAWGSLPDDELTLSGTRRFVRECRASLSTGPAPLRLSVKPTVQLEFEPGRVLMTMDAEFAEPSGRFGQVEAKLPASLRIVELSGADLEHWQSTSEGRLSVTFNDSGSSANKRLRIVGAIAVDEDPQQVGVRPHRLPVPWIEWQGIESLTGFLVASSSSKLEVHTPSGLTLISSESTGAGVTIAPRTRLTYRVDRPHPLGEISWLSMPARVSVRIDSQMTVHPDSAEWVAVLRYDVLGGALDAIHLRMPASWSVAADLHFSGSGHQLTTETRGQTAVWTITPAKPIFGSQMLVVRSSRLLPADSELFYPEITPLGRGAVDACLAVVSGTEGPVSLENPVGLERIEYSSRFQSLEFTTARGVPLGAFRVVKEAPSLRVQIPKASVPTGDSVLNSARVGFADLTVVVMPDQSTLGQGTFETVPGTGSFLSYELPVGSELLWASLDSNPVTPLRSSTGRWSIDLAESRQPHINLIWRTSAGESQSREIARAIGLPRVGQGMSTNLVTVYVPPEWSVGREVAGLRPTSMARLEMARADWLLRSVSDFVPRIDRGSNRDHQKLVTMLIAHEMRLRTASRSEQRVIAGGEGERDRSAGSPDWIQAARARRAEAVRRANLEQDLMVANQYLGQGAKNPPQVSPGVPEPNAPERIRLSGRPISLLGVLPGVDASPAGISLLLEGGSWRTTGNVPVSRMIIALAALLLIGLLTTGWRSGLRASMLALLLSLGLVGFLGGPFALTVALGLAILGFRSGRIGAIA